MSWMVGFNKRWNRDIGYGVPAFCDHPWCTKEIDRGLSHVCGGDAYGGEKGCGLFFCSEHLDCYSKRINGSSELVELCKRCGTYRKPFPIKIDHPKWILHKLIDPTWKEWRMTMWKDISYFSRIDKERIPNVFELTILQPLRIVIVWNHPYYPNQWSFTAYPLWKNEIGLGLDKYYDLEFAKSKALHEVIQHLENIIKHAEEISKAINKKG